MKSATATRHMMGFRILSPFEPMESTMCSIMISHLIRARSRRLRDMLLLLLLLLLGESGGEKVLTRA